jgi:regulator of protease activity HflC (stomatin/prohibitin superfamily)
MTTWGHPSGDVYGEGLHFRLPFIQTLHPMDVRIARSEGEGDAASKDLQQVRVKVIVNYHLDPRAVPVAFRGIAQTTEEVAARIIDPARPEAFKAITARFTAEELITKRTLVRDQIAALLSEKLSRHGLVLDEFSIVNFAFSPSFTAAVEGKVNAEQQRLMAERDLLRIRVEADQKVASATAEAESLRLQRQEVTPQLIELRRTENQRRAIDKWDGKLPTTTAGEAMPFLSLSSPN